MKYSFTILLVFIINLISAQKVSDYKYVSVPENFNDFKEKPYGLEKLLTNSLKAKKYIVLSDNRKTWPADAFANPCKVVNSEVVNEKGFLRNKINLVLKDCDNKVVFSKVTSSNIKEFEAGFQEALKLALIQLPVSNPVDVANEDVKVATIEVKETLNQPIETTSSQKYTNGKLVLQKIQIDGSQFILIDGNNSTPFASFRASTKQDVFRVKLRNGESTIGYYENGNIVIETPNGKDSFSKDVYTAN